VINTSRTNVAIAESMVVTLTWASSFVMVKIALSALGPLTISGARYFLGFVFLLPFVLRRLAAVRDLPARLWGRLFLIGLTAYTIGNGAMFWSLKYLSPTTVSLLNSVLPIIVLAGGMVGLKEIPTWRQVFGVVVSVLGCVLFFVSDGLEVSDPVGLALLAVGIVGFAIFTILGRDVARGDEVDTLTLTAIPLALGGGLTLLIALGVEGLPAFAPDAWAIVLVLALVNTALGYILYNHALRVLTALEMNIILNFIPLCTAIMAWVVLGDSLSFVQIMGVIVVIAGVILVQWGRRANGGEAGG
jgi:drug/metabolite transporter (DMT)-like permease